MQKDKSVKQSTKGSKDLSVKKSREEMAQLRAQQMVDNLNSNVMLDNPEKEPGMDAQQRHDHAMSKRGKSKVTREMLDQFRKENVGLTLQGESTSQIDLVQEVMDAYQVSRDRALKLIDEFGG